MFFFPGTYYRLGKPNDIHIKKHMIWSYHHDIGNNQHVTVITSKDCCHWMTSTLKPTPKLSIIIMPSRLLIDLMKPSK